MNSLHKPPPPPPNPTHTGTYIFDLLKKVNIQHDNKDIVLEMVSFAEDVIFADVQVNPPPPPPTLHPTNKTASPCPAQCD